MNFVRLIRNHWLQLALLLAMIGLGCAGCASTDAENTSARPWNSPEGWQYGTLPSSMRGH
jgi:hypothetical protein